MNACSEGQQSTVASEQDWVLGLVLGLAGVGTLGSKMGIISLTPQVPLRLKGDNSPEISQKTV